MLKFNLDGQLAQLVERVLDVNDVRGSSPLLPTEKIFEAEDLKFLCAEGGAQSAAKP